MRYYFFIFVLLSFLPLWDLFNPGLPITHDGQDHVARIANFYQNLSEGNIIPRWAANLNWGYGHPILMFLYPLPSYITSLFHFLGFNLVDSLKIVFGLAFIVSGVFMFLWVREFLGNLPGFVAGALYIFAPYRFIDLYVRGAIGEHMAFVFPPLILFFLLKLSKHYSPWYVIGGSLSVAGLILSHNAISLMFLPLIFLYAVYLIYQCKSKYFIHNTLYIILLSFGLSAFFWIPSFFEGKYTLRDIVTVGEYSSRFVNFTDLIYSAWNYGISGQFSVQVGIIQWLMVLLSISTTILLFKKKKGLAILSLGSLIVFWLTLFLMLSSSKPIWETITTLQKFQFPWRFLSITVFTTAVLGGLIVSVFSQKKQFVVCCLLFVVLLLFNKDYWQAKNFLLKEESFYTGIYPSTTDTGESSPRWSVRFMEKEPKDRIEVIDGAAEALEVKRTSTYHEYKIEAKEKTRIRENTLYFPGWEVLIDSQKTNIEFQDPESRGLITFFVDRGQHNIKLQFKETKLRLVANYTSLISLLIMFAGAVLWKKLYF